MSVYELCKVVWVNIARKHVQVTFHPKVKRKKKDFLGLLGDYLFDIGIVMLFS